MGVGIAIGPLAGGLLLSRVWWGSVFFVNVPLLTVGALAAWRVVPESRNPVAARPDPVGAMLSIAGLGLLAVGDHRGPCPRVDLVGGADRGDRRGAHADRVRRAGGTQRPPAVEARAVPLAALLGGDRGAALGLFPLVGALFVVTQTLQFDLGFSPLPAGVRILPMAGLLAAAAPLSTPLVRAVGSKLTAAAGLSAVAAGLWWSAAVSTASAS
jgi:hypothetical protein